MPARSPCNGALNLAERPSKAENRRQINGIFGVAASLLLFKCVATAAPTLLCYRAPFHSAADTAASTLSITASTATKPAHGKPSYAQPVAAPRMEEPM